MKNTFSTRNGRQKKAKIDFQVLKSLMATHNYHKKAVFKGKYPALPEFFKTRATIRDIGSDMIF